MTIKTLLGAAALALTTAAPLAAAPINLDFSFGTVTGTFYGLDNATGTSSATSFDINTGDLFSSFLDISPTFLFLNDFLFSGGDLIYASYNSVGENFINIHGNVLSQFEFFVGTDFSYGRTEVFGSTRNTFAPGIVFTQVPVSAVPLPAGAFLLLSGLAGVAGLKRRKKQTA